jgi:chemotaxis protein histidine kinase CheA
LERILSLLEEERAARIEADTKRIDAEMKQKQAHEELLQRIASLEKYRSAAGDGKKKELAEREATVFKRESELTEREKIQAEKEKAFATKVQEAFTTVKQLQEKADRMQKEAEARLAKAVAPVKSATKQEDPLKSTVLASIAGADDKVFSEVKKMANPKHKSISRIVRMIKKDFPPGKAHIVFGDLKHGTLRISSLGKAQHDNLQAQVETVLSAYEVPAPMRKQHASMLIDLVNFGAAIVRNDERYLLLNATVKDAAFAFADERLANHLLQDNNWVKFDMVSGYHKYMQAIETIMRLGTSLSDMNLALSSIEEPDEFDDKENAVTPSEILRSHYKMFAEYESALDLILGVIPESSPIYTPLEAYKTRETAAIHNEWTKAARKFDYTA